MALVPAGFVAAELVPAGFAEAAGTYAGNQLAQYIGDRLRKRVYDYARDKGTQLVQRGRDELTDRVKRLQTGEYRSNTAVSTATHTPNLGVSHPAVKISKAKARRWRGRLLIVAARRRTKGKKGTSGRRYGRY